MHTERRPPKGFDGASNSQVHCAGSRRARAPKLAALVAGRLAHLDHEVSAEVVLEALQLQLQDWREGIKQNTFPGVLHGELQCNPWPQ